LQGEALPTPTGGHRAGTGRLGAEAYSGAARIACRHEDLAVGQRCPVCGYGTLYELPPGVETVLPTSLLDIEDVNRYTPSLSAWNLCRVHRMGAYRHDPTTHPTPRRGQTGSRRSEGPGGADAAWDLERVGSATPAGNPRGRGSGSGVSGVVESPQPSAPGVSQTEAHEA